MDSKQVFVGTEEFLFDPTMTVEDIRQALVTSYPNLDRASYTTDPVTSAITFIMESGEKGNL